jgi:hypothetical protein
VSFGVRVLEQGRVNTRAQLSPDAFVWETRDGLKFRSTTMQVPLAAVVDGLASYNAVAQHHYYFGDPTSFQNPRRAEYEAFDPKLSVIKDTLAKAQTSRPDSREFEAAMLCGYSGCSALLRLTQAVCREPAMRLILLSQRQMEI